MVYQGKILNDSGFLYIIRKVIKRRVRWCHFLKRWLKLLPSENSNMVYANEKDYKNGNILYIVEKLLKKATQWQRFGKR